MDIHSNLFQRHPCAKWFKEWVPHDVVATGGKCFVLKWINEGALNALNDMSKEREFVKTAESKPTTEVLSLCSYAGCGNTFIDAGALRKHSQIHGERQHVCHYRKCGKISRSCQKPFGPIYCNFVGFKRTTRKDWNSLQQLKKFSDSSKLKRHYLIHTEEREFVCPYESCGKAFSLDFNLRSHMKTHSQENYHTCLYPECEKSYAHEYMLKNAITSHHDKLHAQNAADAPPRYTLVGKPVKSPKKFSRVYCPYKGCKKAYIHPYKLNLHLRREHHGHFPGDNAKIVKPCNNDNNYYTENEMEEGSDQKGHAGNTTVQTLNRPMPNSKLPPSKVPQQKYAVDSFSNLSSMVKQPWPVKHEIYGQKEDTEARKGMTWEWDGSRRFG